MFYNFHRPAARFAGALWVISLLLGSILSTASANQSVALEWDPSPDSDVIGYRLCYGTGPGEYTTKVDAGHATTATLEGLEDGRTYYVVVTAYNAAGLESLPSNEVSFTTEVPPPAPDPTPDPDPTPEEEPTPDQETQPEVVLTSPTHKGQLNGPADIVVTASASLGEQTVERVEFYAGAVKIGEATTAPFETTWNGVNPGCYQISAVAHGAEGAVLRSVEVEVEVVPLRTGRMDVLADGSFEIEVQGAVGSIQTVWVSEDLKNWTPLKTTENVTGTCTVRDPAAATKRQRFYKVTSGEENAES